MMRLFFILGCFSLNYSFATYHSLPQDYEEATSYGLSGKGSCSMADNQPALNAMIDLDDLFGDLGSAWETYVEDGDFDHYYGAFTCVRGSQEFKALYLIGEVYRMGKGKMLAAPKQAIWHYKQAIEKCEKDIFFHIASLEEQLLNKYTGPTSRANIQNKINTLKNNADKYDEERRIVKYLAEEKIAYCEEIIERKIQTKTARQNKPQKSYVQLFFSLFN